MATTQIPKFAVRFDRVTAEKINTESWALAQRAVVANCAICVGVAERALELTAAYTSERKQFERPLGTFQAVQQRAADAYIDVQAMRWTMWQAAWRISEGLDAEREVAIAKFWAAEGGQRVVSAAQHLHGGLGSDVDYPLFRYTLWAKDIELEFGAATPTLARMGEVLAR
jgi:alkylation response protein AidB-like acyl-CoA dehydrogenase